MEKKKILIVGNTPKAFALTKKLAEECEVYITSSCDEIKGYAENVDIRENSTSELLEFVLENGIDLTVPVELKALKSDIVELFEKNKQEIFAPSRKAVELLTDKAGVKRMLYKLRIQTPKFGIFEKQQMASEYLKNLRDPFVIKTNEPSSAVIFTKSMPARNTLDSMFMQKGQRVVIEDYVYGSPFAFYAMTDGYKALPLNTSLMYKYSLEGDGGQLTSGTGACVPDYKLSFENENYLVKCVINPTLDYLNMNGAPYTGILRVDGILSEDGKVWVLGYGTFLQDADADGVLGLVNMDLYSLFKSCTLGSFSDDVERIDVRESSAVSLVLNCIARECGENPIDGVDNLDDDTKFTLYSNIRHNKYLELEAEYGAVCVLTCFAGNSAQASERVYSEAEEIKFIGKSYRKDICRQLSGVYY